MDLPPLIPDHDLLRLIGRGAYGEVWLARNVMGIMRAVKIVRRTSFESHRPFEREFAAVKRYEPVSRAAAGLVNVLHAGRAADGGLFHYVMELADPAEAGTSAEEEPDKYTPCTLRTMIGRLGRLPVSECLEIAVSLAHGIAALHRTGLVHRDVKPSNIIFVSSRAKLADIGLVGDISESRSYVGTEGYVPPEGPGLPGADLYGLGRVLYEMVTGYEAMRFPALPPDWVQRGEPGAFEFYEVVLRCCEPDAARRYSKADELLADLTLLQSGQSVRQVRQMRGRIALLKKFAAAAAVAGVGAAAIAWWQGREAGVQRRLVQRAEKAEAEARRHLFDGLVQQARNARRGGTVEARFVSLDLLEKAAALHPGWPGLREEFISALATPGLRRLSQFTATGALSVCNADLTRCLMSDGDALHLLELPGGRVLRRLTAPETPRLIPVHVGNNGNLCAARDDRGRLLFWNDGLLQPPVEAPGEGDTHWSVADDASMALAWRGDGTLSAIPLRSKEEAQRWKFSTGFTADHQSGTVLSSTAHLCALAPVGGMETFVFRVPGGKPAHTLKSPRPLNGVLAMSADGHVIAAGMMDGGIAVWRTGGAAACEVIEAGSSYISALAMSSDGRFLLSSTWAAVTKLWDLADATSPGRLDLPSGYYRFSAGGHRLAAHAGQQWVLYEFAAGVCQALVLPRQRIHSPDTAGLTSTFVLHPHTPWLFYRCGSSVCLTDAAALRPARQWPVRAELEALSTDGRWLFLGGRTLTRIPLQEKAGAWSVGFPQLLSAGGSGDSSAHRFLQVATTPDGSLSSALCSGQSYHLFRDAAQTGKLPRPAIGTDSVSLHADGQWIGDAERNGPVRVLHAPSGREVKSWPATGSWPVHSFSPDGKFFTWSDSRGLHSMHSGTWEPAWESPLGANGALGFFFHYDPLSRWIMFSNEPGTVHLLDAATGKPATALRRDRETWSCHFAMNAGGSLLCELDQRTQVIWRWDLSTIRAALRDRGLDWTTAPLPPPLPEEASLLTGLLLSLPGFPSQDGK